MHLKVQLLVHGKQACVHRDWDPLQLLYSLENGHLTKVWDTFTFLCIGEPYLRDIHWDTSSTSGSGRYVVRLEVQDVPVVSGPTNTQYDSIIVWLDNKSMTIYIDGIEGITRCEDVLLSKFKGKTANIKGIAWDPLILDAAPATHPNDNFGMYSMSFAKQGGVHISIPPSTTTRVPNILPGPLPPGLYGTLANWDIITAIDAGPAPSHYMPPPPGKLYRGESCVYDIYLSANDTTLVDDNGHNHGHTIPYPLKIVNDL